jgi:phosphate/sulfate permease
MGFTLAAIYAMAIGGNDTANSVASPFGGGVASYNKLLLIFAISVFLGAILQGHMVIKTLGKGVVSDLDLYATFCNCFCFHIGLYGLILFFCYYYCVYSFTV